MIILILNVTLHVIYITQFKNRYNMIEQFGINAGKIWTILDEKGKQEIKEIKKATKLTDKNLYAALGWLSREGKIKMVEVGKEIFVTLI